MGNPALTDIVNVTTESVVLLLKNDVSWKFYRIVQCTVTDQSSTPVGGQWEKFTVRQWGRAQNGYTSAAFGFERDHDPGNALGKKTASGYTEVQRESGRLTMTWEAFEKAVDLSIKDTKDESGIARMTVSNLTEGPLTAQDDDSALSELGDVILGLIQKVTDGADAFVVLQQMHRSRERVEEYKMKLLRVLSYQDTLESMVTERVQ